MQHMVTKHFHNYKLTTGMCPFSGSAVCLPSAPCSFFYLEDYIPLDPLKFRVLTPIKTLVLLYHLTYHGMLTTCKLFLNCIKHLVY